MLDENFPTYRFRPSSDDPLQTLLYFSHNGSDPTPAYLLKRPAPSSAPGQYAVGLIDPLCTSVVYAEVLLRPEWSQPTLSAAEMRAQATSASPATPPQVPITPESFTLTLYNPDQDFAVRQHAGSWGKSDAWEFEMPERSFKLPSASQLDQDATAAVADLIPKVVFRWKRDGRLSKDMTCYMTGKSVAGNKSKEPDITVAFFRSKHDGALSVYEPNMARVDVEDRRGLEMALIMTAEVIRDLYLNPQDPFNTMGSLYAAGRQRQRTNSRPVAGAGVAAAAAAAPSGGAAMSGALGGATSGPSSSANPRNQADIDAETRRLQAMVEEEERLARERRDREEQQRIEQMLEDEEKQRRQREADIDLETERLRREYGVDGQGFATAPRPGSPSPQLPPRPTLGVPENASGMPPRPLSVGAVRPENQSPPPLNQPQSSQVPSQSQANGGRKKHGLSSLLSGPYAGPAAASVSTFFGRSEEERRQKMKKKRSVHF